MRTTRSETSSEPLAHVGSEPSPSTSTRSATIYYLAAEVVAPAAPELPQGTVRIGDYVAAEEQSDRRKSDLAQARTTFAEMFLKNEPTTIRTLRLRRGLSQSQLASRMGTSQSHIARIELGRNDPGYDTFHRLSICLLY